ncbi:hypothetical protein OXPF_12990 [Oxobacter pfennigii]|uniref:DUF2442 domain-containing protein n=1 Tax=Oxobacter pfennigii TaxID=36849 RepID=A0A0P8YD57_9CLOT|nr:hypothetical protein OXPF_12990 [Oxobacter pfennigii]
MQSPNIKGANALKGHMLIITFENDEKKIFDLKPYLKYPVFEPLKDYKEFLDFIIEDGTIEWKCGADLSPDTFYLESFDYNEEVSLKEM